MGRQILVVEGDEAQAAQAVDHLRAAGYAVSWLRGGTLQVDDLSIDLGAREVRVGERRVGLTRLEFELLVALARKPGEVLTRRWLQRHLLGAGRDAGERTLDVHVSRLRKKLGSDRTWVETAWGIGYRLTSGR